MKSKIQSLNDTFNLLIPTLSKYVDNKSAQRLKERLADKTIDATPNIMVFGIYNAGKSTFLNALIGESRAKMADRPETSVVTSYEWNGFKLLDTPGIDAPEAHERVSREQLEKTDIILFVLATDSGFEEKYVYQEIIKIVKSHRLMMLIINNKNSYNEDEASYRAIYDKILVNLNKEGRECSLPSLADDIQIHLVNAKSALKGKLENKKNLIKKSGIEEVSISIEKFLHESSTHQVALILKNDIYCLLDEAMKNIDDLKLNAKNYVLIEQQEAVLGEKMRIVRCVTNYIKQVSSKFEQEFMLAANSCDENSMKLLFDSTLRAVEEKLTDEIFDTNKVLVRLLDKNIDEGVDIDISAYEIGLNNNTGLVTSTEKNHKTLNSVKQIISQVGQKNIEDATKKATIIALQTTKEWLPSLMKGTGQKTIEKIATGVSGTMSKMAPFIGPAIDIVMGIHNYHQADKKQKEQEENIRREKQALVSQAQKTSAKFNLDLIEASVDVIETLFQPIELFIEGEISRIQTDEKFLLEDRLLLESIKYELDELSYN